MTDFTTDYAALGLHGITAFHLAPRLPTPAPIPTKAEKRSYASRFKTVAAKENHLANARRHAKIRSEAARIRRNELNVVAYGKRQEADRLRGLA